MSGLGYEVRDMNLEELLVHHEPAIVRGQLNGALRRVLTRLPSSIYTTRLTPSTVRA